MIPQDAPASLHRWSLEARFPLDAPLPTVADVDAVVVGAGPAGVAAATVLGEAGLSVVIIEKYGFAGGAAVAGMSGTICGMYLATDTGAAPEQVVFGFTQRFHDALAVRGGLTTPQRYGKTWTSAHDPLMWREVADEMMVGAGVRIMFHTALVGVLAEGDTLHGVVVESNAGRAVVRARRVVDASGDAAVVARAGWDYRFGEGGRIQNPTMFFRLGNVDTDAFTSAYGEDTICPTWVTDAIIEAQTGGADLPRHKIWIFQTTRPNELLVNATRLAAPGGRPLNVIDPEDFTIAEISGRSQVRAYQEFLTKTVAGCANGYVVDTGVEAGIRQTRTIVGVETLTDDDVVACRKRDDGICRVPWPIELHDGERPRLHWLLDDYYEVPYLALVPELGENVIVAGRSLSAEHQALASARVTAQCFEYGHAAAVATIAALEGDVRYRDVPGPLVRNRMNRNGSAL